MTRLPWVAVPLLLVLGSSTVSAQTRFAVELNGGAAFPTQDLGDAALKTGAGFGFAGNVQVMQHMHVYAGWDWHRFVTDTPFEGADYDVDDTGYTLGARFQHPVMDKLDLWLRGGALFNHIELEDESGDIIADSDHELGWEAGGGAAYKVSDRLTVMPGARYRTFSTDLSLGQNTIPVDLSYVTLELALNWKFGAPSASAAR